MNKYLTPGMARVLREMVEATESGDEELVYSLHGGWWIGLRRTNGKVALGLLSLCLINEAQDSVPDFQRYTINEDGRKILESDTYVPRILRTKQGRVAYTMFKAGRRG